MSFINIEIKAYCNDPEGAEFLLVQENADFKGLDHQVDTYFHVPSGRLKLREGNIENSLIHYDREDQGGPKTSHVSLYHPAPGPELKALLMKALGVLVVVDKQRKIFFIDNVKFHIDTVTGLGNFIEIEAIDQEGRMGMEKLQEQCRYYMKLLNIHTNELVSVSYSDLLIKEKRT